MKKIVFLFLCLFILSSCGGSDSGTDSTPGSGNQPPKVITSAPGFTQGKVKFNGNVASKGSGIYTRGFCWGTNINPTALNSDHISESADAAGEYSLTESYGSLKFSTATSYYVRAYVITTNGETVYGDNITFTTPPKLVINPKATKAIFTTSATLNAEIAVYYLDSITPDEKGFCYRTSPGVNISNGTKIVNTVANYYNGNLELEATALLSNTTYYVRAFSREGSKVYYSDEYTFKTAGAIGASGGYIFYDKGEVTDGWRYLEAAPNNLIYNGSDKIRWGCAGGIVNQTQATFGAGPANTARIISQCSDANCAARLCDNYVLNGLTDWFLPSDEELLVFLKSSKNVYTIATFTWNNYSDRYFWSSTENPGTSKARFLDGYDGYISSTDKDYYQVRVRPFRRF
ncbi:hypothetical protein [uncultured Chryseobacterium sp.]|uniref:hypothetical protein n=1 Tax=uncultured Chryseobacterium sp. TaxID=259322 RepID=UPI0025EEFD00|nr:hypothetical protein [uncultured Chryseobacterium sp.]